MKSPIGRVRARSARPVFGLLMTVALLTVSCRPEADRETASVALEAERAREASLGEQAAARRAPTEAAGHFGRCVELAPDDAECRYGLGRALVELGELDRAAVEIAAAAERLDRPEVWAELGKVERRRRRFDAAKAAFSHALGRDRHHLPSLLGLGQILVATGDKEIGEELLERHREEAAFEDHLAAFRRAAAEPDAEVEVLLQLAQMYHRRDDPEREEATLRQAVARAPDSLAAKLALVNHLVHQGKAEEAERVVGEFGPDADHPAALFLRGILALSLGAAEEADRHFAASLAAGEWPPLVYVDAGKAWAAAGAPERAADAFRRAIEGAPDSGPAYLGLALAQRELGLRGEAMASTERALKLDPLDSQALFLRAVLRFELGDPRRASDAFERALEIRRLDLLPAGGAADLRKVLDELAPSAEAVALFERELERYQTEVPEQARPGAAQFR